MPFDVANVKDSVITIARKQLASPIFDVEAEKLNLGLLRGKADVPTKEKIIVDLIIRSMPKHMDFMASWSGDHISLVHKSTDVIMASTRAQRP